MSPITLLAAALAVACLPVSDAFRDKVKATVYLPKSDDFGTAHRKPKVKYDVLDKENGAAYAVWDNAHNVTGWGYLWISATPNETPERAMYATGYLEGALTYTNIWFMFNNVRDDWFDKSAVPRHLIGFLNTNMDWTQKMVETAKSSKTDDDMSDDERKFWWGVGLYLNQLSGLVDGYNDHCEPGQELTLFDILLLTADGDLEDLIPLFWKIEPNGYKPRDRCSALIKLLPDKSDILFGHATWDHYGLMIRTLKVYNLTLSCAPGQWAERGDVCTQWTHSDSVSASPGFLTSVDDWFITSAGLAVIETTNTNYNKQLTRFIGPFTVLSWTRTLVANLLAEDGKSWTKYFSMYNSGTYNNQWMILDMKKFLPGSNLTAGTLTVLEQIPGMIVDQDMSSVLEQKGFWASYNVPFFGKVYNESGWQHKFEKSGNEFSHDNCPRGKIFKKRQGQVKDIEGMKWIMRYNDWKNDPESNGDPGSSIAGRKDLAQGDQFELDGAIDAKVSSFEMAWGFGGSKKGHEGSLSFHAVNGPTTENQPPFVWKQEYDAIKSHYGQPEVYNFTWITYGPINI